MIKALAIVRTVFLIFIVGYTVRAMPVFVNQARTFDESYARCADSLSLMNKAAWFAIAWIAFETVVGWLMASRRPKVAEKAPQGGEPPFAPPPQR
jgi:hypothetical protein